MQQALEAYNETKAAFEQRIVDLNAHHATARAKRDSFFEEQVLELRTKAQRHVEVQKALRKESEDKLNAELSEKQGTIEDLRDNLADLRTDNKQKDKQIAKQAASIQQCEHALRVADVESLLETHVVSRVLDTELGKDEVALEVNHVATVQRLQAEHAATSALMDVVQQVEMLALQDQCTQALQAVDLLRVEAVEAEEHNSQFIADKLTAVEATHAQELQQAHTQAAAAVDQLVAAKCS